MTHAGQSLPGAVLTRFHILHAWPAVAPHPHALCIALDASTAPDQFHQEAAR